jgi:hypothetical protein
MVLDDQPKYNFTNILNSNYLFLRTHDSFWHTAKGKSIAINFLPETFLVNGYPAFLV